MGGSQSKQHKIVLLLIEDFKFQNPNDIKQNEFCSQIFKKLNKNIEHSQATPMISDTQVLKSFYNFMKKKYPDFSKSILMQKINKIYKRHEKLIQYSYHMIENEGKQSIQKRVFVNFIKSCYKNGLTIILNKIKDNQRLKKSLNDWLNKHDESIMNSIQTLFNDNALSNKQYWTFGDYKRWILSKQNWFIYIQINDQIHRIPLNLPGIFGIDNFQI